MKNINVRLEDERHEDLLLIQKHFSDEAGVKLSQAQALKRLLYETANKIRKGGSGNEA